MRVDLYIHKLDLPLGIRKQWLLGHWSWACNQVPIMIGHDYQMDGSHLSYDLKEDRYTRL